MLFVCKVAYGQGWYRFHVVSSFDHSNAWSLNNPAQGCFRNEAAIIDLPSTDPPFALEKLVKLTGKIANSFWIEKTGRKLNWVVSKLCVYHQAFLYRPTDLSLPILLLFIFIFIFIFFIFFTIRVRIYRTIVDV